MRKLLISFLTIVLVLTFSVSALADGDWQVVEQVINNGSRVGITVGAENADPHLMFAISEPVKFHNGIVFNISWEEPRLLVSNDCGKTWRQIKWPPALTSDCDCTIIPYFYKGKLRVDVNEYEVHFNSFFDYSCQLAQVCTYETADGSSWSIIDEQKTKATYKLHLSQGELMALPEHGFEIMLATNVKEYYAADEQTVLFIKDDGTLHRAVINGSKALINGVNASLFVKSEPSNLGTKTIAAVNYQPLAISVSKDNGCTWNSINCEMPGKVFGYNKNLKVFLTNNNLIGVTDLSKAALVSKDNGTSWKTINLPTLTGRNIGESIQFINDSGTTIVFYVTKHDTYRYEYKMEQRTDLKPAS